MTSTKTNNIRNLREKAGLSEMQLGKYLGISSSEMEMLEAGEKLLTTVQLEKLCCIFRCPEDHLLGLADGQYDQPDMSSFTSEELEAIASIARIHDNLKLLNMLLEEENVRL